MLVFKRQQSTNLIYQQCEGVKIGLNWIKLNSIILHPDMQNSGASNVVYFDLTGLQYT
ncbi:MAG: hypothetical protein ACI90V_007536 [Bacillariaceae sp.]|jgi:hypothetical protein